MNEQQFLEELAAKMNQNQGFLIQPSSLNQLEEKNTIRSYIEKRNIKWLCHFTPRKNLDSIKKNGLLLRNNLDFDAVVTDYSRFDRYRDAICLSISKPNKWMFEKKLDQGFDLCLLLINPTVLYEKRCAFYPHNAATASYRNIAFEELMGSQAFENLFSNPIQFQKSGKEPQFIWRNSFLNNSETTSDQAEVQCIENIDVHFIDYIIEDDIPLTYNEIDNFVSQKENKKQTALNILSGLRDRKIETSHLDELIRLSNELERQQEEIRLKELERKRQEEIRLKELERKRQEEIRLKELERKRQEEIRLKELERKRQEEIKLKELEKQRRARIRLEELERNRRTESNYSSSDGYLGIIILVVLFLIFIF